MKQNLFFSRRATLACAAVLAAATLSSCNNDSTAPGGGTGAAVAAATTPPVSAQVATAVEGPAVLVTDASGNPVAGVRVDFDVSGGGAVQFPVATTDANGIASAGLWQIGPKVGSNTVTATVAGLTPVTFTLASEAGPASAIGIFGGNAQAGAPGSTLATPLSVRVADAGGNPREGETVTFAVTSGGGSLASTTATTDANGVATSGAFTLGTGQCGQTATATSGTVGTVTFFESSRGDITVGGSQSGTLSTTDCVIDGAYADEYDLTTDAGAINVSMTAGFDAVVDVITADGSAFVASDDNGGGGTDASLRLITASGSKAVRATSASGGETGAYTVSVASTSSAVTDCTPVYIEVGASTTQAVTTADCHTNNEDLGAGGGQVAGDAYYVYFKAGTTYRMTMTSDPLDALMELYAPSGAFLGIRDNAGVSAATPEVLNFTPSVSGFYKVVATSYCLVFADPYQPNCDYGGYTFGVIKP